MTFYEYLKIRQDASQEEILRAYKRRVKETHPDRNGDSRESMNVKKGYAILSNPERRKLYDAWLKTKDCNQQNKFRRDKANHDHRMYLAYTALRNIINNRSELSHNLKEYIIRHGFERIHSMIIPIEDNPSIIASQTIISIIDNNLCSDNFMPEIKQLIKLRDICNEIIQGQMTSNNIHTDNFSTNKTKQGYNNHNKKNRDWPLLISMLTGLLVILGIIGTLIYAIKSETSKDNKEETISPTYATESTNNYYHNTPSKQPTFWTSELANYLSPKESIIQPEETPNYKETTNNIYEHTESLIIDNELFFNNGDSPYNYYYGAGKYDYDSLSKLTLINKGNQDAVVLLYTTQVIRNVYVKHGNTITLKYIPSGSCIVKIMFGNRWDGDKYNGPDAPTGGFAEDVSYTESSWDDPFNFTPDKTDDGISYPTYSLTLHKVANGNFNTKTISKYDFF